MSLPSAITAAPTPVRAMGRDLLVSPLSDADFDELSLWYQARVLRIARASLSPDSTASERDETLQAAYRQAASIDFVTEFHLFGEGRGGPLAQKESLVQFVWRILRRASKPAVTLDEARQIVQSGDGLTEILDVWNLVQFGERPTEAIGKKADPTSPAP